MIPSKINTVLVDNVKEAVAYLRLGGRFTETIHTNINHVHAPLFFDSTGVSYSRTIELAWHSGP